MVWVRTPDDLYEREEVLTVGLDALALHQAALGYSNRNLTDGRIPTTKAPRLAAVADPASVIMRLVAAGWWRATDAGYQLVYLLELQPTARTVLAKREATAKRVAEYRARSNGVTDGVSTPLPVNPDPVPGIPDPVPGPSAVPSSRSEASGGSARPRAKTPGEHTGTRTNVRLAAIIDLVREHRVPIHPTSRDGAALKSCAAEPELIAEAYIAAYRGEWDPIDDGFIQGNLSLHLVIDRLAGFLAKTASRSRAAGEYLETRYGRLRVAEHDPVDDGGIPTMGPLDPHGVAF